MGEKKKQVGAPHRALYRKYRSRSLDEIVGQEHITKTLANAVKQGKISHAYLFTGPRGTGKTSIARILAHEINNLRYTDDSTNLDIIEIDAASNRRIDDIRELKEKVNIAPISAAYKVYIIDEVHMLTTESFNALLKTLEEPPAHVVFILATTEVHKLPATIISRTQRHSFRLVPTEKVAAHLKEIAKHESIKLDDDAAILLAEYGEGSFRDSISLLDQIGGGDEPVTVELIELLVGLAPQPTLEKLLDATQNGDSKEILSQIENLLAAGLAPAAIAAQLLKLLRGKARQGNASKETVLLMQQLLAVSGSMYPQLKLETTLLGINSKEANHITDENASGAKPTKTTAPAQVKPKDSDTSTHSAPEVTPHADNSEQKSAVITPQKADTEEASEKSASKKVSGDFSIEKDWPTILEVTKQKNNPLYTVLRLAIPELNSGELTLYFAFPFHQKKINEPKYKSMISQIIHEQTGAEVAVTATVDKTKVKSDSQPATSEQHHPARASLISSVQDIMGGGEVVNI